MKKITGCLLFLFTLVCILIIPALTPAGTSVIEICTEGSGDILELNTSQVNHNGAMVWNGSQWVVNNTWAHQFFANTSVALPPGETTCTYEPARVKSYSGPPAYQGTAPTGVLETYLGHTVTRNLYNYIQPAREGNPFYAYAYQAVEYVIQHPTIYGIKNVILRSRGLGQGVNEAFFNIYIEDYTATGIQTTAFRGDPKWYTYPVNAADALNRTSATDYLTGDLPGAATLLGTRVGEYFLDIGGGSDMGPAGFGKSFQFNTSALEPSNMVITNLGSSFPIDFNLKWMDGDGTLQMMRFLPALVSETPQRCLYLPLILNGLSLVLPK